MIFFSGKVNWKQIEVTRESLVNITELQLISKLSALAWMDGKIREVNFKSHSSPNLNEILVYEERVYAQKNLVHCERDLTQNVFYI